MKSRKSVVSCRFFIDKIRATLRINSTIKILKKAERYLKMRWIPLWWSWRESNPRPNKENKRFLHVYCFFIVGKGKEKHNLTPTLSSFISLFNRSLKKLAQSFYDVSFNQKR